MYEKDDIEQLEKAEFLKIMNAEQVKIKDELDVLHDNYIILSTVEPAKLYDDMCSRGLYDTLMEGLAKIVSATARYAMIVEVKHEIDLDINNKLAYGILENEGILLPILGEYTASIKDLESNRLYI